MEYRDINEIKPYDRNPRNNEKSVDRVLSSLNKYGQVKPIVLSAKGKPFEDEVVCCGHTTLEALKKFGAKEVKVVIKEFETEKHFVGYNIEDNKSGEFSEWDDQELANLNADFDIDLAGMGFDFDVPELEEPSDSEGGASEPKKCPHCGEKI
jgi:ParB-like chromosome segregation protein Spo0J